MKKVNLPSASFYQLQLAAMFAINSVNTNLDAYKKRNQSDLSKIKADIEVGKIAEFCVFNYVISEGKKCTTPDLMIYDRRLKSFDCDLQMQGFGIQVKSHTINKNFPISWVFQPEDPIVKNPKKTDLIFLVCFENQFSAPYAYICNAVKLQNLYKPAEKASLNKAVIYESDLIA